MESHGKRLDQRRLHRAHLIRDFEAEPGFVRHILLKNAVHRRSGEKNHIFTQIISAFLTVFTVAAGFSGLKGHPVPGYQIRHALSRFHHNAARFVTQHKGRLYHIVPDSC